MNVGSVVFMSLCTHVYMYSTHTHAAMYSYGRLIVGITHSELDGRSTLIGPIPWTYDAAKLFGSSKGLCTNFATVIQ